MGEDPAKVQPGQRVERARHRERLLGNDTHAAVADVDLEQDVEPAVRGREHLGQRARPLHAVRAHREACPGGQGEQAPGLVASHHGVGNEDVAVSERRRGNIAFRA